MATLSPVGDSYRYPELLRLGGGVGDVARFLSILNNEIFLPARLAVSQTPLRHQDVLCNVQRDVWPRHIKMFLLLIEL